MKNIILIVLSMLFVNCNGNVIKSSVSARHSQYLAIEESWPNPYVTDGLVAMWDGEWNAGIGRHNGASTTWVDLSGNGFDVSSSNLRWTDKALDDTASNLRFDLGDLGCNNGITVEAVVTCPNIRNNGMIVDFYNHVDLGMSMSTTTLASPFAIRMSARNSSIFYSGYPPAHDFMCSAACTWTGNICRFYFFGSFDRYVSLTYVPPPCYFILGSSASIYQNFRGYVHCIRVYDRALSEEEIAFNYSIDQERFELP